MKKVVINPGCISCGSCEFICPEVFQVTDIAYVKKDATIQKHADAVKQAAASCPVSVISYKENKKECDE